MAVFYATEAEGGLQCMSMRWANSQTGCYTSWFWSSMTHLSMYLNAVALELRMSTAALSSSLPSTSPVCPLAAGGQAVRAAEGPFWQNLPHFRDILTRNRKRCTQQKGRMTP